MVMCVQITWREEQKERTRYRLLDLATYRVFVLYKYTLQSMLNYETLGRPPRHMVVVHSAQSISKHNVLTGFMVYVYVRAVICGK